MKGGAFITYFTFEVDLLEIKNIIVTVCELDLKRNVKTLENNSKI